jgi:protein-disulfide isomerase
MYSNSRAINREKILTWAKDLGLDMARFTAALDAPATKAAVERDLADGEQAGVNATPTIYLNGKKYQGSLEPQVLIPLIAAELKSAK